MKMWQSMRQADFEHEGFCDKSHEEIDNYYQKIAGRYSVFCTQYYLQKEKKRLYKNAGASTAWVVAGFVIGYVMVYVLIFKFIASIIFGI